jgi:selenocysteine-specific elongation factor
LVSGSLALQDVVELYPSGTRARIRGLQVHGTPVDRANAGERTAVNLAGIDSADVCRGMTLAPPGLFQATRQVDCVFDLLASTHPLKHRAPVHFHAGTAEVEAQARLIDSLDPVRPGTRANVRFLLREPLLMLPGDRFIVRMFSPVVTIGGGVVLDIAAPRRIRRTALAARLKTLDGATPAERIALLVRESAHGMSVADLVARTGFLASEIRAIAEAGEFLYLPEPQARLASREWAEKLIADLRAALAVFHRANPLQPGLSKEELRSRHFGDAPPFLLDALLARTKDLVAEGDLVRLASHRLALKQDEEAAVAKIEALFLEGGLAVPATSEVLAKSGVEAARARSLLQILLRARKLVRVGEDLVYHASAIEGLRALLVLRKGTRFAVSDFKEWTGVSRKYAIPLLEFLDRQRVTRREGDSRVVL